jgi:hypothetical protein
VSLVFFALLLSTAESPSLWSGNHPWRFRRTSAAAQSGDRGNYEALGTKVGLDLVQIILIAPTLQRMRSNAEDFDIWGCLPFAEADDVSGVTMH